MRRFLLAAALTAIPSAALACQCDDPSALPESELADFARIMAVHAVTIAEVESVPASEGRYRTIRHLFGDRREVIGDVRVAQRPPSPFPPAPFSSCDYGLAPGQRAVMAFVPPGGGRAAAKAVAERGGCGVLGAAAIADHQHSAANGSIPAGMCTQAVVQLPGMVDRIRRAAAKLGRLDR